MPVIFVEPSHAYLGFYKDKSKKKLVLLETTLAGNVDIVAIDDKVDTASGLLPLEVLDKYKKYLTEKDIEKYLAGTTTLEQLKRTISRTNFNNAINYNIKRYNENKKYFSQPNNHNYQKLDISELRQLVLPIQSRSGRYSFRMMTMQDNLQLREAD